MCQSRQLCLYIKDLLLLHPVYLLTLCLISFFLLELLKKMVIQYFFNYLKIQKINFLNLKFFKIIEQFFLLNLKFFNLLFAAAFHLAFNQT